MKTRGQIQLDYKRAMSQADELEQLAARLGRISSGDAEDVMRGVQGAWAGENGAVYIRKGRRITMLIKQHRDTLLKTAEVLRKAAQGTYYAEMRSIEIIERGRNKSFS